MKKKDMQCKLNTEKENEDTGTTNTATNKYKNR